MEVEENFEFKVLSEFLSDSEIQQISRDVSSKIENFFQEKLDKVISAKAIYETQRKNIDSKLNQYSEKDQAQKLELKECHAKLALAEKYVLEIQHQLNESRNEILNNKDSLLRLEKENAELRQYKDVYTDENNMLHLQIGRRNTESERLQSELTALTTQLQSAITAKCKAYAEMEEIRSKELSLDFREKHFQQEREFLFQKVAGLEEELSKRVNESQNCRSETSARLLVLQTRLSQCEEELKISNDSMVDMRDANLKLQHRCEELTQKLEDQRNHELTMHASYREEVMAQTRLADLYKGMSEEANSKANDYSEAIQELQKLVEKATEQYGLLESKHNDTIDLHEQEISEKQRLIDELSKELNITTELLKTVKQDRLDLAVEELAPTAAIASKILKKGLSLTQIYTQLVESQNDLNIVKDENKKLKSQMEIILREIEEKAPLLQQQREDYESASSEIALLTMKLDEVLVENNNLLEKVDEVKKIADYHARENQKLKIEQADLARQVCYLLKEVQDSRTAGLKIGKNINEMEVDELTSSQIISKKLVTFKDIEDLQKNNQKLLSIVRTLSARQEEIEKSAEQIASNGLKEKLNRYIEQLSDMQKAQERQTKMLENLSKQRDMYKNMYHQLMKQSGQDFDNEVASEGTLKKLNSRENINQKMFTEDNETAMNNYIDDNLRKKYQELEKKLSQITTDLELCKKEKSTQEKMLKDEIERLRKEAETSSNNCCQLKAKLDTANERFSLLQNNVITYKTQIKVLEEKCATYNTTIGKHEQSLMILKDEAFSAESRLSKAEVQLENLRQERQLLRDSESRLIKEREVMQRERQTHALLKADVESIKISLERVQAEGQYRMEKQLDDVTRECAALRRRLQEEQDRFRELSTKLEKQLASSQKQLAEEKLLSDKIQSELSASKSAEQNYLKKLEEIENKLKQVSSNSPTKTTSVSDAAAFTKLKTLETQLSNSQSEVQSLTDQLKAARFQSQQYCDIAESAELQLREANDQFNKTKENLEKSLNSANNEIVAYKTKVEELEDKIRNLPVGQLGDNSESKNKLVSALQQIEQLKSELDTSKQELKAALNAASIAEEKYAKEMMLHSTDLQLLSKLKEEVQANRSNNAEVLQQEVSAKESLILEKSMWKERENQLLNEMKELQERTKDLDVQNKLLHDQIQELSERTVLINHQKIDTPDYSSPISESNPCSNEEYSKSMEQLLQVIKFLRREKDLAFTKFDVLKTENVRLKSQIELSDKQLKEIQEVMRKERENRDVSVVTASKHSELLRKVETLNAITDSNRILREERDSLITKIKELSDINNSLSSEVIPLREKTQSLEEKNEILTQENSTLKNEALRWRQRANSLIERANKASPEDWRRLQLERENLSKLLTAERETHNKQSEELNSLKNEKTRLEDKIQHLQGQLKSNEDQIGKLTEDVRKLNQDLNSSITDINEKTKELLNLRKELADKETVLADVKNKENQIRKIAKKYKAQYEELLKNVEDKQSENNSSNQASVKSTSEDDSLVDQHKEDTSFKNKVDELNQQILSKQNECEQLKKEVDNINKSSLEKEERAKQVLKGARTKIMQLTEYKKLCEKEMHDLKEKLDTSTTECESSISEYEARLTALKSQMDGRIARLEQERLDLLTEKENLQQKILQLQRNLSGSSNLNVGSSDPPTANIKPMSARTETPLASIRPMSVLVQSRTAAVLPTTAGAPLLVATPTSQQQLVHTTDVNSPTSSHVDYQPASTSRQLIVQPQLSESAESTQHEVSEIIEVVNQQQHLQQQPSDPTQQEHQQPDQQQKQLTEHYTLHQYQQQQQQEQQQQLLQQSGQLTVALVSPRMEQQQLPTLSSEQQTIPSSSTQSVTTSQLITGQKRSRNLESLMLNQSESNENTAQDQVSSPQVKRSRQETTSPTLPSASDVEYQVPTSSQRDQDEEVNDSCVEVVDCDEGNIHQVVEEEYDNEPYEDMEEDVAYREGDNADNEVEIIAGNDSINQESLLQNQPEISTNQSQSEATSSAAVPRESNLFASHSSPVSHIPRQQSQQHLVLPQHGYEDGGDDCIVPSTPTLYVPRRNDSFGEPGNSIQVPQSRFTFSESSASTSLSNVQTHLATSSGSQVVYSELAQVVYDGIDDTRIDLTQLEDAGAGCSVPTTPQRVSPTIEQMTPMTFDVESEAPTIQTVTLDVSLDETSTAQQDSSTAVTTESTSIASTVDIPEKAKKSDDNVSSEKEKINDDADISEVTSDETVSVELKEDSQESEISASGSGRQTTMQTTSNPEEISSPIRGATARRSARNAFRAARGGRPTPIIWDNQAVTRGQTAPRGHPPRGAVNDGQRARGVRGRRMRAKYYNY